jgi:hypothetical protein
MLKSGSSREHTLTDQTPSHVLTDDKERLADLVGARGVRASPDFFVSSHVDQQ